MLGMIQASRIPHHMAHIQRAFHPFTLKTRIGVMRKPLRRRHGPTHDVTRRTEVYQ